MSATVDYKGNTIASWNSGTKILNTSGTWLEDDITIGVTAPNLQSRTVTPSASQQTITPASGYDGLSSVIVNGDADLIASNIKSGVNIFGVTGNLVGGLTYLTGTYTPTSDSSSFNITLSPAQTTESSIVCIYDTNASTAPTPSNISLIGVNLNKMLGVALTTSYYGISHCLYRNSSNFLTTQTSMYTSYYTGRIFARNGFRLDSSPSTWVAGRTYRWYVIWT